MFCLLLIGLVVCDVVYGSPEAVADENGILELTDANFNSTIQKYNYLLVEFYAPWCANCKDLEPEYNLTAKILATEDPSIRLAKVDVIKERNLAQRFQIKSYPQAKFFRNGFPIEYTIIDKKATEIAEWLKKKKLGISAVYVDTMEQLTAIADKHEFVVVGLFTNKDSPAEKEFLLVAEEQDEDVFVITHDKAIFKNYRLESDKVIILTKFDNGLMTLDDKVTSQNIRNFVEVYRLPSVVEFTSETAPKIFARKLRAHVLLFIHKDTKKFNKTLDAYKLVSSFFRGKVLMIYVDCGDKQYEKILTWFHLNATDCPQTRLIELDGPVKYKPEVDKWSVDQLKKFIQDALDGKQQPHFVSQEIPEDWDALPVKVLVGQNFDKIARDKTKDVFVMFYAPWCGFCKELAPTWTQLGEKYATSENVLIAKFDATANEAEGIRIPMFPTLTLFPKNSDEAIDFPQLGNKTLENLSKFVELGGQLPDEEVGTTPDDLNLNKEEL